MQLENYFEFLGEDDIRIRGTRVGIETVLEDYHEGSSPEEIAARYHSLTLEQVYATITYYWRHQSQIDGYLQAWRDYSDQAAQEHEQRPSKVIKRLKTIRVRQQMHLVEYPQCSIGYLHAG